MLLFSVFFSFIFLLIFQVHCSRFLSAHPLLVTQQFYTQNSCRQTKFESWPRLQITTLLSALHLGPLIRVFITVQSGHHGPRRTSSPVSSPFPPWCPHWPAWATALCTHEPDWAPHSSTQLCPPQIGPYIPHIFCLHHVSEVRPLSVCFNPCPFPATPGYTLPCTSSPVHPPHRVTLSSWPYNVKYLHNLAVAAKITHCKRFLWSWMHNVMSIIAADLVSLQPKTVSDKVLEVSDFLKFFINSSEPP